MLKDGRIARSSKWQSSSSISNRDIIVPLFDNYKLKSSKLDDYKIWREAAVVIAHNRLHTRDCLDQIRELKTILEQGKRDRQ